MGKIVIFGAGKIAEVAYSYLTSDSPHEIAAFTIDESYMTKKELFGLPIVPFEELEKHCSPDKYKMLVIIGYHNLNKIRAKKYQQAKDKGYQLISYISTKSNIDKSVIIGENCFICEFNSIQAGCKIGNNVVMWPNNTVSHHCKINDHNWITAGVTISGVTTIESYCFIGVNTAIGHEITIGCETLIGAGSIITKNVEPNGVYIAGDTPKYKLDSATFLRLTKL